eukprot:TRINITY_DN4211_c0_g1_i2.p1 TRINITY_DN4211_c0_g1~~TRINITY_DN4211_c0_g1_i2.p1  ORF type:complete len:287 (+),score=95.57 TRINITY_DN4211_c0_g1_i2:66-926(+)
MPKVTWYEGAQEPKSEEGAVKILASFLFVNGTKRRKLADLREAPKRGGEGQVLLHFGAGAEDWCDVTFDSHEQGYAFERAVLAATGKKPSLSPAAENDVKPGALPHGWEERVQTAIARAKEKRFTNPLPDDSSIGGVKGQEAVRLIRQLASAWESCDLQRQEQQKEAVRSLEDSVEQERQLREKVEEENRTLEVKLQESASLTEQLQKRATFYENEANSMRKRSEELRKVGVNDLFEKNQFLESELKSMREYLLELTGKPHGKTAHGKPPAKVAVKALLKPSNAGQ